MRVSAQVSLYPLRERALSPAIEAFRGALDRAGLDVETGAMSTLVTGDSSRLFAALAEAFEQAARDRQVVVVVTVSNACPVTARSAGDLGAV